MRKWHRWIGLVALVFVLAVTITGIVLQTQEIFGEKEAEKERLARLTSPYSLSGSLADFAPKLEKALAAVRASPQGGSEAKINRVDLQLKGESPTFTIHTEGSAKRKFVINANTAVMESQGVEESESFLLRLHTGEAFGDGGLVLVLVGAIALLVLVVTGVVIYWQMRGAAKSRKGLGKIFW